MKKMFKNKKGFTLVELIVVLAILAIITVIAVPTAFGSIEKAKDSAARASIGGLESAVRTIKGMSNLDDTSAFGGSLYLTYEKGKFSKTYPGMVSSDFEDFFLENLNKAGLEVSEEAVFLISMTVPTDKNKNWDYMIMYAPTGRSGDKLNLPYYSYTLSSNSFVKTEK